MVPIQFPVDVLHNRGQVAEIRITPIDMLSPIRLESNVVPELALHVIEAFENRLLVSAGAPARASQFSLNISIP